MFFHLDIINILIATIAVLNTVYGLSVFSRNRKSVTNQSFFFLTLAVSTWGVAMLFLRSSTDDLTGVWSARALYAAAALIPFASIYFSYLFPDDSKTLSFSQKYFLPFPLIFILILTLLPNNGLIEGVQIIKGGEPIIQFNTLIHSLYLVYIISFFSWVYIILFNKLFSAVGILRIQTVYILIGTLTTTGIGVFTNLLLPYFGIFSLNWVGQIGILAMITFILYSILRHHLFTIKVIATEIFVIILQLTLFTQIFIAQTLEERLLAVGIFSSALVIGVLLVRSVIREVDSKEQIQKLYKELEIKNQRVTELDKLKNQFLSIASHDLRAPLTAIRNFMSLLLDGTYGKLPPAAEDGMKQVFDRTTDMADMVDNYLNVSRIEQGRMKYDFADADILPILKETVQAFTPVAGKKGLSLTLSTNERALPMRADASKMREVFENLISNGINYTEKGGIAVTAERVGTRARIVFSDTGIGMSKETISKLFGLFNAGEDSRKYNPKSTGVGLYITKAHVEAHKGTVRAESDGEGKGSRFVVELPLR